MNEHSHIKTSRKPAIWGVLAAILGSLIFAITVWWINYFLMLSKGQMVPDIISMNFGSISTGVLIGLAYLGFAYLYGSNEISSGLKLDRDLIDGTTISRWLKAQQVFLVLSLAVLLALILSIMDSKFPASTTAFEINAMKGVLVAYALLNIIAIRHAYKKIAKVKETFDSTECNVADDGSYIPFDRDQTVRLSDKQISDKINKLLVFMRSRSEHLESMTEDMNAIQKEIEANNEALTKDIEKGGDPSTSRLKKDAEVAHHLAQSAKVIAEFKTEQVQLVEDVEYLLSALDERVEILTNEKERITQSNTPS